MLLKSYIQICEVATLVPHSAILEMFFMGFLLKYRLDKDNFNFFCGQSNYLQLLTFCSRTKNTNVMSENLGKYLETKFYWLL